MTPGSTPLIKRAQPFRRVPPRGEGVRYSALGGLPRPRTIYPPFHTLACLSHVRLFTSPTPHGLPLADNFPLIHSTLRANHLGRRPGK